MSTAFAADRTVIARDGDTVDQLCWRHLGQTGAVTEATVQLNPGLADRTHLQAGQKITLAPPSVGTRKLVNIFD